MDGWRREFWAYSAQPLNWFQESWWSWQKVCRKWTISWIFFSICLFVWGWYPDDRLRVRPRSLKNPFQTRVTNCGPRSDTMSSDMPKYLKTELNNNLAVIMVVGKPLRGKSRQDLENRSIIHSIHVLSSESGGSVMKSTPQV